jgi:membrane-bound lytic murein transglycosylase D
MHPEKATEAACKYLRDLYRMFHDWELVLAAYNWGAGNVQRVIRKTGKRNFWDMYPHMPAETRNYVPTFTAIMYAMTYAKEHDLHSPDLRYQHYEQLDTLTLRGQALDLRRLSRALGYSDSLALTRYNPELRHAGLPAGYRPYVLRFPAAAREHLGDVDYTTLLAYCQPAAELPRPLTPLLAHLEGAEPWWQSAQLAHADTQVATPRFRRLNYTVRRGQTIATVAEKYHVSPAQVRKWNGLRKGQLLKPGHQLVVLVPAPTPIAPRAEQTLVAAAAPPPVTVATLRRTVPTDSTLQVLAAANARYARQAQERAARELAQAQELVRLKKQLAARAAAQQRLSIAQAAAAAKATAATHLGVPTDTIATNTPVATALVSLPTQPSVAPRATKRREVARATARQPEPAASLVATDLGEATEDAGTTQRASRSNAAARPVAETRRTKEEKNEYAPVLYTVRPGDNLTKLAQAQGISVEQLKTWNKLSTETVLAGQQLRLTAPADATALPVVAQASAPRRAKSTPNDSPRLETRTVQPGDTLFSIAKRFGLTLTELKRLNHLATDQVKLGQKLVVGG